MLAFACASAAPAPEATPAPQPAAAAAPAEAAPARQEPNDTMRPVLEAAASEAATETDKVGRRGLDPAKDRDAVSGWLDDPEKGRRYYLARIPLDAVAYRNPDGSYRTKFGGIDIEIDSQDEEWVYYRVYDYSDVKTKVFRPKPTAEEQEAARQRFAVSLPHADRTRFEPYGRGLPESGQFRNGLVVTDMNGDGILDIVHGPLRKRPDQRPVIFLGDGQGNWRLWTDLHFPDRHLAYGDVAVADFDGDGRPDIALGMHLVGLTVMVQREPGVFSDWSRGLDYEVPGRLGGTGGAAAGFSSRAIAATDWDGDGRPDLVALGEGPRLNTGPEGPRTNMTESFGAVVYLNQGDGSWKRIDEGTSREQLFGDSMALGDLDGDHRPDFVVGSNFMGRQDLLFLGRGGEGFEESSLDAVRSDAYTQNVAVGDFDGDGLDDIAASYLVLGAGQWFAGIDVLLNGGGSWRSLPLWSRQGRIAATALGTGDLDGDGAVDLVALTGDGDLLAFLGDGHGGFVQEETPEVATSRGNCRGYDVVLVDLDGDGRDDIVASYAGEPGAEVLFSPGGERSCPNEGALDAWRSKAP